jgi:oligoendopeptidase F
MIFNNKRCGGRLMKKRILLLTGILALGVIAHFYLDQNYPNNSGESDKNIVQNKSEKVQKKEKEIVDTKLVKGDEKVKDKYSWNLDDIYKSWDLWDEDFAKLDNLMKEVEKYKGRLNENPDTFIKFLKLQEKADILSYKVYLYPNMKKDLNGNDGVAVDKLQRIMTLFSQYSTATAWVNPEILSIPEDTMKSWIAENEELKPYKFNLLEIYRLQSHVLDSKSEKLISYYNQFQGAPKSIYSELSTTDVKFHEVTFKDGNKLPMTYGNYSKVMATNLDQDERKKAFDAHYKTFEDYKNTYGAIYRSSLQRDFAVAQTRNYNSTLEAALEKNNIPTSVYDTLIEVAKKNSEPLKRYARLRKELLGLEEYHSYDGSIPLVDFQKDYDYEEAKEYVYNSISPLGEDYAKKMEMALDDGWIDAFL